MHGACVKKNIELRHYCMLAGKLNTRNVKPDYYQKFSLSKFFAIGTKIKPNHVLFCMGNIRNGKIDGDQVEFRTKLLI